MLLDGNKKNWVTKKKGGGGEINSNQNMEKKKKGEMNYN